MACCLQIWGKAVRVQRIWVSEKAPKDVLARKKRSIEVDLKSFDGVGAVLRLIDSADAVFEGFRPGVMERLGLGPEICIGLDRNEKIVYGTMTGWGQSGPMAHAAGHDINSIALAGAFSESSGTNTLGGGAHLQKRRVTDWLAVGGRAIARWRGRLIAWPIRCLLGE